MRREHSRLTRSKKARNSSYVQDRSASRCCEFATSRQSFVQPLALPIGGLYAFPRRVFRRAARCTAREGETMVRALSLTTRAVPLVVALFAQSAVSAAAPVCAGCHEQSHTSTMLHAHGAKN